MKYLRFQNKVTKAFTLAEVLITLTIIGVVSALVIPAIIQDTQNAQFHTAAKKVLSLANQAYIQAVMDNGGAFAPYNGAHSDQAEIKFNALKSKLNVIKDCPYNSNAMGNCWASSGVGAEGVYINGCSKFSNSPSWQGTNNSFATSDGMFWMLYSYVPPDASDYFVVDVNGSRGPNDWGKDVYAFRLNETTVTPLSSSCNLRHNDNSTVSITEWMAPFKQ